MKVLRCFATFIAGCNLGYGAGSMLYAEWQQAGTHAALGIALLLVLPLAQEAACE